MAGPGDEIDGDADKMLQWNTKAYVQMDPTGDIFPGMDEGKAYKARDHTATEALTRFVSDAADGSNAYNFTATRSGHAYLAADGAGANEFSKIYQPLTEISRTVGVTSEWPPATK